MNSKLNVIVAGASGFIGKQVTIGLLEQGYKVFAITRQTCKPFELPDLIWCSWDKYAEVISSNHNIHAVINLATTYGHGEESWPEIFKCNVIQPIELFTHAIRVGAKKIINTDSFFGKTEFDYQHLVNYTKSKNELVCATKKLISSKDTSFINLRLEHVIGANDGPKKFISKLITDFQSDIKNIPLTDGTQKRDFIYVYDVVSAFICVLKHPSEKGFIEHEVGTGKSLELKQLCLALAEAFNVSSDKLDFGAINQRPNEIMNSYANIKSLNSIGWMPKWDLSSAISDLALREQL